MIDPAGGNAKSHFITASDGVRLHYLRWRSERSPPSAVLIFLHGIASHAGWFAETAADLNHQGVDVYGLDRRGSGRSGGPRGHLDCYERALDDVEQLVRLVSADHPGTPVFLAASSGAAVRADAARPGPAAAGQPRTMAPGSGRRRAPGAPAGPPAHPADAGAVHRQPTLSRLHPRRSAAAAGGHDPVLLGDGPAGPPPPA